MFNESKKSIQEKDSFNCLSLDQFVAFSTGNVTTEERNKIQQHLEKCSLCEDAFDGVKIYPDKEQIKSKMLDLNESFQKRLAAKKPKRLDRTIYYPLAAAAAVVMIIIGIYFLIFLQSPNDQLFTQYFEPYPNTIPLYRSDRVVLPLQHAMVEYEIENYSEALSRLKTMISKDPNNVTAHFYAGICELKMNNTDQAIGHFQTVKSTSSSDFIEPANWYLALAFIKNNDLKKAKQILNSIVNNKCEYAHQSALLLDQLK